MSQDCDVLRLRHGGHVQLKERDEAGADEVEDGRKDGTPPAVGSLLRTALAGSSLPQILLALGVVVAVLLVGLLHRSDVVSGIKALASADSAWLALATVMSMALWVSGTIAQLGSMPVTPPVRRVFAVQVAASFVNHLLPATSGGVVVNIRFLQRYGLGRGAAVGSVGLNSLAGLFTHLTLFAGAVAMSPAMLGRVRTQFNWWSWWHSLASLPAIVWIGAVAGLTLLVGAGFLLASTPRAMAWGRLLRARFGSLRRRVLGEIKSLGAVVRDPSRAAALWLGSLSVPLMHAMIQYAVLRSIGAPIGVGTVVVTYVVISSVTAVVPSPGGIGALDVALPAAFAAIGGISLTSAMAAVLGYRLLTVWVPLLPGAAMFAYLLRRRII